MNENKDLVAIVEAAYTFEGDQESWLRRLGRAALPMLDRGMGLLAFTFDASDRHHVICSDQVPIGAAAEEAARDATAMNAEVPSELLAHVLLSLSGFGTASELSGQGEDLKDDPYYRKFLHRHGMYDFLGVIGINPPGTGVSLGTPLASIESTTPADREVWSKIAAHVAAAARLREVASEGELIGSPFEDAEAILAPDGRIEHAEGRAAETDAREQLSRAVRNIEVARGPLRRKAPEQALEHWPGLLNRRWSVHEVEDTDGRRLLVARANLPQPERLQEMSPAVRQTAWYCAHLHPDDLIAYELGMPVEEVEQILDTLAGALGAATRDDLAALLRALIFEAEAK